MLVAGRHGRQGTARPGAAPRAAADRWTVQCPRTEVPVRKETQVSRSRLSRRATPAGTELLEVVRPVRRAVPDRCDIIWCQISCQTGHWTMDTGPDMGRAQTGVTSSGVRSGVRPDTGHWSGHGAGPVGFPTQAHLPPFSRLLVFFLSSLSRPAGPVTYPNIPGSNIS